jgi:hypothetical protein
VLIIEAASEAYVYQGQWIADCAHPDCANAEELKPKQTILYCTNCRQVAELRWPADVDEISRVLAVRPVPQTRNWAPAGHRQAVGCRVPDGQTVADLRAENDEHGVVG